MTLLTLVEFDFEAAQREGNVFGSDDFSQQNFAVLEEGQFEAMQGTQVDSEEGAEREAGVPEIPSEPLQDERLAELEDVLKSVVLSIKAAAEQLKPPERVEGDEARDPKEAAAEAALIGATGNLTHVIAELVRVATLAQHSVWKLSGAPDGQQREAYHRDKAWEEGLISAAKDVGANIQHLVQATNDISQGATTDSVLASMREISGATARLVTAARVKIPPDSKYLLDLESAASAAKAATTELKDSVTAHTEAVTAPSKEEDVDLTQVTVHKKKLEALSDVARLERELELARLRVQNIQKSAYEKGKQSPQQSSEKTVEVVAEQTVEVVTEQTTAPVTEQAAEYTTEHTTEHTTTTTTEQISEQTIEQSTDQS